jgi:hypothetical protein
MIDKVFASGRFLGMIQPKVDGKHQSGNNSRMYDVGCLGRISTFSEVGDGRYSIILSGLSRFRIVKEMATLDPWRTVVADYSQYENDLNREQDFNFVRKPFIDALQAYFATHEVTGSWEAIEKADQATLIASVAMAVPFSPQEKQAILECQSIAKQGEMLQSLMEMAVYEKANLTGKVKH